MYNGGSVSKIHKGVTSRILINTVVNAGRVVADVAVLCVERKSVIVMNGSRRILHLVVNIVSVSTISSNDLCWGEEDERLWPLTSCFSPVLDVEDNGEYLLEYMPSMRKTTPLTGVAYRTILLPNKHTAQNAANSRNDSQGSSVLHDSRPTNLFRGKIKGCECANARVTCGGVATRSGDFLCTMIVERCFVVAE